MLFQWKPVEAASAHAIVLKLTPVFFATSDSNAAIYIMKYPCDMKFCVATESLPGIVDSALGTLKSSRALIWLTRNMAMRQSILGVRPGPESIFSNRSNT